MSRVIPIHEIVLSPIVWARWIALVSCLRGVSDTRIELDGTQVVLLAEHSRGTVRLEVADIEWMGREVC